MNILLTGINHKTAPVEMRELLAIAPGRLTDATRVLLNVPGVEEAMILSTCNRAEVLALIGRTVLIYWVFSEIILE